MAKAKTYIIKYTAVYGGQTMHKESTFISKAGTIAEVIDRWKNLLPKMARPQLTVISCKPKETDEQKQARLAAFEKDLLPNKPKDNWQLITADDTVWIPDTSGVYCLINWQLLVNTVRIDIMSADHTPIISFEGTADNVRKHSMRWFAAWSDVAKSSNGIGVISLEHAAYIGSELEKADTMRADYVQDADKPTACQKALKQTMAMADADAEQKAIMADADKSNHLHMDGLGQTFYVQSNGDKIAQILDMKRWCLFNHIVPEQTAYAESAYYLHCCPDTKNVFLCENGKDNNIAVVHDISAFLADID